MAVPDRKPARKRGLGLVAIAVALGLVGAGLWYSVEAPTWRLRRMSITQLEAEVQRRPTDIDARYQLGSAYARANRHLEATRELVTVLQDDPSRADVLNDLGVSYLFQERFHEARVAFQAALTAQPGFPSAHANLGRLYLATRMPYSAVRELETAAAAAPRRTDILLDLGLAYIASMNFRSAEATYQKAIRVNPRDAAAHTGLGRAYHGLARYEEAEAALQKALRLDPNEPVALLTLGQLKRDQSAATEGHEAARELLARAVEADPGEPDAWYELGRTEVTLNRPAEAAKHLQRALALSSEHTGAMLQLSRALDRLGREKEARELRARFRKGVLRAREVGRLEERALASPQDWEIKTRLAELYLESGRTGLAALICRQLRDAVPNHPKLAGLQAQVDQRSTQQAQPTQPAPQGATRE